MTDHEQPPEHDDDAPARPEPDALSRLVELLAEERIIQPSLADFLR